MQNIKYMFFVPIFHYKVNDWENKKRNLLEYWNLTKNECIQDENNLIHNFNLTPNNSKINYLIHQTFSEEINNFTKDIEMGCYEFIRGWFESTLKYSYHAPHNHGALGYSSVCFIEYDQNFHRPPTFFSPFNNFINGDSLLYTADDISEGSILFFPSSILHCTDVNYSDVQRLVVSFNLRLK